MSDKPNSKRFSPRRTIDGRSPYNHFFNRRRHLRLDRDQSQHRRFAALYDDLLS
jgi:hypothetical protein